jgi:hypothetical protein
MERAVTLTNALEPRGVQKSLLNLISELLRNTSLEFNNACVSVRALIEKARTRLAATVAAVVAAELSYSSFEIARAHHATGAPNSGYSQRLLDAVTKASEASDIASLLATAASEVHAAFVTAESVAIDMTIERFNGFRTTVLRYLPEVEPRRDVLAFLHRKLGNPGVALSAYAALAAASYYACDYAKWVPLSTYVGTYVAARQVVVEMEQRLLPTVVQQQWWVQTTGLPNPVEYIRRFERALFGDMARAAAAGFTAPTQCVVQ